MSLDSPASRVVVEDTGHDRVSIAEEVDRPTVLYSFCGTQLGLNSETYRVELQSIDTEYHHGRELSPDGK